MKSVPMPSPWQPRPSLLAWTQWLMVRPQEVRKWPRCPHSVGSTCTVQYSTVQYSTVQYSTVQYSTKLWNRSSRSCFVSGLEVECSPELRAAPRLGRRSTASGWRPAGGAPSGTHPSARKWGWYLATPDIDSEDDQSCSVLHLCESESSISICESESLVLTINMTLHNVFACTK